jgi:hypothetical protein
MEIAALVLIDKNKVLLFDSLNVFFAVPQLILYGLCVALDMDNADERSKGNGLFGCNCGGKCFLAAPPLKGKRAALKEGG